MSRRWGVLFAAFLIPLGAFGLWPGPVGQGGGITVAAGLLLAVAGFGLGRWRRPHRDGAGAPGRWARERMLLSMSANMTGVFLRRVMSANGAFRYDFISDRAPEYLGLEVEALRGNPSLFFECIDPDHREAYRRALIESARTLAPLDVEFRRVPPPGQPAAIWLRSSSRPFLSPEGEVVWDVFVRDVTERKRAAHALLAASRRTAGILDAMVDAVIIADHGGLIEEFNRAAERLFGVGAAEVIGQAVHTVIPGALPEAGGGTGFGRELTGIRRDGTCFPLELTLGELTLGELTLDTGDSGDRLFIAVIRDTTARKALERGLAEARERAESANLAKTTFLTNMSHELRSPLNAINGYSQLLLMSANGGPPLAPRQREQVEIIRRAGHHVLKLIEDILDLAKIESGHLSVTPEPVDMVDVVTEVCASMADLAARQRVVLEVVPPDAPVRPVHADPTRVVQVLTNLISNAIKYNRAHGRVSVSVRRLPGHRVQLSVSDTGIGIASDRQHQLFQPFNRLGAEFSGVEGTGVGLALARTLTELMGGKLDFTSIPGQGSTFRIELPAVRVRDDPDDAGGLRAPVSTLPSWPGRFTVLYIDRNADDLALMAAFFLQLPEADLLTTTAGDLELTLGRGRRPDVILLGVHGTGGDGFTILERLRDDPGLSTIPVMALSTDARPELIARGHAAGFRAWLTKPLDFPELLRALERVVPSRPEEAPCVAGIP